MKQLLSEYPELQDNDKQLLLKFWEQEGLTLDENQKFIFLRCTHPETICRARRYVQKQCDWLRGKSYQDNVFKAQAVAKRFREEK